MKLTSIEKNVMENLRNISGENIERIDNILKGLMMYALMQYSDNEPIIIPHFGVLKISYKGDSIIEGKRTSDLEINFFPSNEVVTNIGYLEDLKKSGNSEDILEIPIIKEISKNFESSLKSVLENGEEE